MTHSKETGHLTDAALLRYARQILLDGWDIDAQLRLKASRVVIIGAGGLGCPASEMLVRAGLGQVHLIDDDAIEASNLQRQTLFLPEDIGKPKALTAAHMLTKINSLVRARGTVARLSEDNAYELLEMASGKPDLLLDCTDNFATRDIINRISVRYQRSEERRVGKECRFRWWRYQSMKKRRIIRR